MKKFYKILTTLLLVLIIATPVYAITLDELLIEFSNFLDSESSFGATLRTLSPWRRISPDTVKPRNASTTNIQLDDGSYINYGNTTSSDGYGVRDSVGTMQFKNSGGAWTNFGTGSGGGGGDDDMATSGSIVYPLDNRALVVGGTATTSDEGQILEWIGLALGDTLRFIIGTSTNFTATGTLHTNILVAEATSTFATATIDSLEVNSLAHFQDTSFFDATSTMATSVIASLKVRSLVHFLDTFFVNATTTLATTSISQLETSGNVIMDNGGIYSNQEEFYIYPGVGGTYGSLSIQGPNVAGSESQWTIYSPDNLNDWLNFSVAKSASTTQLSTGGTITDFIFNNGGNVYPNQPHNLGIPGKEWDKLYVNGIVGSATSSFAGNVGIGTDSPNAPLEVQSEFQGSVGGWSSGILHITNTGTDANDNAVITGHNNNSTNKQLWYLGSTANTNDNIAFINRQSGTLSFSTDNATRLTIDANGKVGIGTTTPDYKTESVGTSTAGFFGVSQNSAGDLFNIDNSGNAIFGADVSLLSDNRIFFDTNNTSYMSWDTNFGTFRMSDSNGDASFSAENGVFFYAECDDDGGGNCVPEIHITDADGVYLDAQGTTGNKIRWRAGSSSFADFQNVNLTANRTFEMPDLDGTFLMATGTQDIITSGTLTVTVTSTLSTTTFKNYDNCTLKTDAEGDMLCGTDQTGAAGAGYWAKSGLSVYTTSTDWNVGIGTITPTHKLDLVGNMLLTYTATEADTHGLELTVNAAGFGDVKGLDINYITGAQASGSDDAVMFVGIDETLSTDGEVFGLEVLTTDVGGTDVYAIKAGATVGPVLQQSGTFINMNSATSSAGGCVAGDYCLAEFITGTVNVAIFTADNDYIIIGHSTTFDEIEMIFASSSSVNLKPTFQYSIGNGAFVDFDPTDGTNGMENTGVIAWDPLDIPSWAVGTSTEYQIKIIRTKNNVTVTPIEDFIQIAVDTRYVWDKNGDLLVRNTTSTDSYMATLQTSGNTVIGGSLMIGTSSDDGYAINVGFGKKMRLTSSSSDDGGEIIVLQNTSPVTKATIAWKDAIGISKMWLTMHASSSAGVGHGHGSWETSDVSGALQTRLGIEYDCDYDCVMQINQSELFITRNGGETNGNLHMNGGVFRHTSSFSFYPYYATNATVALRITTTTTDRIELIALGSSYLEIPEFLVIPTQAVMVGTTTPAGGAQLTVGKNGATGTVLGPIIDLRQLGTAINGTSNNQLGKINFSGRDLAAGEDGIGAQIRGEASDFWNGGTNDYPSTLSFWTAPDGAGDGLLERLTIDQDGNIGVATATPYYPLDVNGTVRADKFIGQVGSFAFPMYVASTTASYNDGGRQWMAPQNLTITSIWGSCNTGTTTIQMEERTQTDRYATGTDILTTALSFGNREASTTAFDNGQITQFNTVTFRTKTIAGAPRDCNLSVIYKTDN